MNVYTVYLFSNNECCRDFAFPYDLLNKISI